MFEVKAFLQGAERVQLSEKFLDAEQAPNKLMLGATMAPSRSEQAILARGEI